MEEIKKDASYGVGMSIGQSLQNQSLDQIDLDHFLDGIKAVFSKGELKFSPQEANEKIGLFINKINETKFAANKKNGEDFLAENAKRDSVTTLPSGLQYEVINEGSGEKPSENAQVTVHYHGMLIDGSTFENTADSGQPATFGVNQVIKGWTEALQLMPVGAKWKLFIPQEMAYGANPNPNGPIQPYMALIFEVELLSIN